MESLFLFLLASAGLSFIIVHATIMDKLKIRPFLQKFTFTRELIKCALCVGVYTSAFLYFIGSSALDYVEALKYIFSGSIFSLFVERFIIFLDELILLLEDERKIFTAKKEST